MSQITMIEALQASGPLPGSAEKLQLFGQFVGGWDALVINFNADGSSQIIEAEWHFGWALEGRAVQDVWIAPKRSLRGGAGNPAAGGDYGTSLRYYDAKIDAWRSTWIGPVKGKAILFVARQVNDEIVLEGKLETGTELKWIFSEIKKESFRWRSIESTDGWKSENKIQEMFCRRISLG